MSRHQPPSAGASEEVLDHHARQHPCDAGVTARTCPCGTTKAIICKGCGEILFVGVEPLTWCPHAAALLPEVAA
jgi:hypothetical protein